MATSFFDDPRMLAPPRTVKTELGGGAFTLHSPDPLQPYARCVGEWLERWAAETPDAPAFGERAASGGWALLRWGELRQRVGSVAQALLDLKLPDERPQDSASRVRPPRGSRKLGSGPAFPCERPIVVLSDNALDHLVLLLAGMHIGRPVCTVSSGYCRLAQGDYAKIHAIQALPRIADMAQSDGLFVESLISAIAQGDEAAKERVRDFLEKRAGKVGKSK